MRSPKRYISDQTKTFGVRFNRFLYDELIEKGYATSHQTALKFYEAFYEAYFFRVRGWDRKKQDPPKPRGGNRRKKPAANITPTSITPGLGVNTASALKPTSMSQLIAMCPYPEGHKFREHWIDEQKQRMGL